MELFSWYNALPNIADFIDKVGLSMAVWFVTIFLVYRVFYGFGYKIIFKMWDKISPVIDAHFQLVYTMKENLTKQTDIMAKTQTLIEHKFNEQNSILKHHSDCLKDLKDFHENEIAERISCPINSERFTHGAKRSSGGTPAE
jgi:hypothetical protein